jgi:hypothetical protein
LNNYDIKINYKDIDKKIIAFEKIWYLKIEKN